VAAPVVVKRKPVTPHVVPHVVPPVVPHVASATSQNKHVYLEPNGRNIINIPR